MTADHDTSILNSLIATTLDSADGYRRAADQADTHRFADMFRTSAAERETVVRQLQQVVRAHGGNPEDDGTILAAAHRGFLGLRDMLTGDRDDRAIIAEVERGEDYIKEKYETALADTSLSGDARAAVQAAYQSVREGHDRVSALKHGMGA